MKTCGGGEASGSRDGVPQVPGGAEGHREAGKHGGERGEDEPGEEGGSQREKGK